MAAVVYPQDGVAGQLDTLHDQCLVIPEADVLTELASLQAAGTCPDLLLNNVARTDVSDVPCDDARDGCSALLTAGLSCKDSTMISDCRQTCGLCDGHRRAQIMAACVLKDFDDEATAVNAACCDDAGCTGVPTVCDAKCAIPFNDFFERCQNILELQIAAEQMAQYTQLYRTCSQDLPVEPLLRAVIACRAPPGTVSAAPTFVVSSGSCTTSSNDHCVRSPNFPGNYGNSESCAIEISGPGTVSTTTFHTESCCDHLTIDGHAYSGTTAPTGMIVSSGTSITWRTDGSDTDPGFELCADGAVSGGGSGQSSYMYTLVSDRFCNDDGGSYATDAEAEAACDVNAACTGIYDSYCDAREGVKLCMDATQSDLGSSSQGSCVYWKGGASAGHITGVGGWVLQTASESCDTTCSGVGKSCTAGDWDVHDEQSMRAALAAVGDDATRCSEYVSSTNTVSPYVVTTGPGSCKFEPPGEATVCDTNDLVSEYRKLCKCL